MTFSPYDCDNTPDDAPRFLHSADCPECDGAGYIEEYEGGRVRLVQCGTCEERKDES